MNQRATPGDSSPGSQLGKRSTAPPTVRARQLRGTQTDAERRLWAGLRGRQLEGLKFRRQQPFGPYVLDFFCALYQVAVEVDGGQHFASPGGQEDTRRTAYLLERGVTVLRFSNLDVLTRLEGVIAAILVALPRDESRGSGA